MGGGLQKVCSLSLDELFFTIDCNVFHQPLCRDKQSHYLESGWSYSWLLNRSVLPRLGLSGKLYCSRWARLLYTAPKQELSTYTTNLHCLTVLRMRQPKVIRCAVTVSFHSGLGSSALSWSAGPRTRQRAKHLINRTLTAHHVVAVGWELQSDYIYYVRTMQA